MEEEVEGRENNTRLPVYKQNHKVTRSEKPLVANAQAQVRELRVILAHVHVEVEV